MKLQYKLSLIIFGFGVIFLLGVESISYLYKRSHYMLELNSHLLESARERADHIDITMKSKTGVAAALSSAPVIKEALYRSNSSFENMSDDDRDREIKRLNDRWMKTADSYDPFVSSYMTNPAASFFKEHMEKNKGEYGEIFLTNRYGVMIATTGKLTTLAHAHKYWWLASFAEGKGRIFLDDRGFDASVKGYVMGITLPVMEDGEIIGILKCNVSMESILLDAVHGFKLGERGGVKVARSGGRIVLEKGKEILSTIAPALLVEDMKNRGEGSIPIKDGKRVLLYAYAPVSITSGSAEYGFGGKGESIDHIMGNVGELWYVLLSQDLEEALSPLKGELRREIFVGFFIVFIMGLISLLIGKRLSLPITRMAVLARKIGEGDFNAHMDVRSNDELGHLGRSLNRMSKELRESTTSLDALGEEVAERMKAEEKVRSILTAAGEGIIVSNANSTISIVNSELCRTFGYLEKELIGQDVEILMPEKYRKAHGEGMKRFLESGAAKVLGSRIELEGLRKDGTVFPLEVRIEETGETRREEKVFVASIRDITDRKQMEETLYFIAQQGWDSGGENFFDALVKYLAHILNVDYAFVGKIIDNEAVRTVALYANGKIEENIEYSLEGTPCEDVVGKEFCCYPENIKELFPKDEMLIPMEAEAYIGIPIWDSRGKSIGLISVLSKKAMSEVESVKALLQLVAIRAAHEMERTIVDEELRKSEAMLKEAQKITQMGHWDLDLDSNKLYWSDEIYNIFEMDKGTFEPTYEAFLSSIHPDDRESVNRAYSESLKERKPYDIVHRLLMKDGRVKYVNEKSRTEYDDGKALRSLGTVQDITAIKEAQIGLEKAKLKAEEASRAKTDFLSRMSHELRTPLNSILGYAQIIKSGSEKLDEKQELCLDEIVSAGWHLTDLVNEVLDISRVESGNLELKLEPLDICPITEECIKLIAPLAQGRSIKIKSNLKVCNNEKVFGDKTRLKEVFLNLLSNAVKYNVESGTVSILCDKIDERRLLISVVDSGKGISEEDRKLLFIPFSRIKGEDPAIQGTGIGLAISKRLVELMGGEIGVETAPGKGSTFWVKLQISEDIR